MTLIQANALNIPLAAGCVQCVATSPPYWGLRKYEGAQTFEWPEVQYAPLAGLPPITVPAMRCELGLEPTPEAYIGHLVAVFREVRRVLREDGTCWLNLGDSYASTSGIKEQRPQRDSSGGFGNSGNTRGVQSWTNGAIVSVEKKFDALKPKDLVGIPWRAAFALQADGWYLRSDVIWAKRNCMPESVTDRPTKSHEYVFLLAKAERYFYDAEAVKEPNTINPNWNYGSERYRKDASRIRANEMVQYIKGERGWHGMGAAGPDAGGRNRRTVWHIATQPFAGAHFAVWPPALVEPMVKAGTSERGCCPVCGAGWVRVVEREAGSDLTWKQADGATAKHAGRIEQGLSSDKSGFNKGSKEDYYANQPHNRTTGWQPTCTCGRDDTVPALVLDPFNGSGTTGVVARNLGRRYVGLDVGYAYLHDIARPRMSTEFGREPVATAAAEAALSDLPLFAGGDR